MSGLGDIVTDLGSAVGDLFGSQGNAAEANSFSSAATLATQNAQLTAASTRIQETQTARQLFQTEGTQEADVAGAGFTESGSALDLLKSSMQQGSLAKSLVNIQGAIQENSYAAQAGAYSGEAAAAKEASQAGTISAIGAIGGALVNGSGALVDAGKTVVQGYNYITGLLTGAPAVSAATDAATAASQFTTGAADLSSTITDTQFLAPGVTGSELLSSTDTAISQGADLGSAFADASSGVALDTSGLAIGTSLDAVSSGISAAFDAISGDIIPGVGILSAADQIPGVSSTPVIGPIADAASWVSDQVTGFVSDAIGAGEDLLNTISFGLSVICTAFYKQDIINRTIWLAAQRYGQSLDQDTFSGYLYWASPVAKRITADKDFAKCVAPFLTPAINEMARIMDGKKTTGTLYGMLSHRILFATSWIIGRILKTQKGDSHVQARA